MTNSIRALLQSNDVIPYNISSIMMRPCLNTKHNTPHEVASRDTYKYIYLILCEILQNAQY